MVRRTRVEIRVETMPSSVEDSLLDFHAGDEGDEEEEEDDYDESLALAWRLQQEDDDRALLMAMNGGIEPPEGATERSDLGVPRCCGAFTPSTRVVSRRGGRGWFLFRF